MKKQNNQNYQFNLQLLFNNSLGNPYLCQEKYKIKYALMIYGLLCMDFYQQSYYCLHLRVTGHQNVSVKKSIQNYSSRIFTGQMPFLMPN